MGKFARWTTPEGLALLAAWSREGCGPAEIARRCGVREAALRGWARRCPAVGEALRGTREVVDAQVEAALLKRALGYVYTEAVEDINGENVKQRETHKYEPPNVMAQKLWLSCRKPEQWGGRAGDGEALSRLDAMLAALGAEDERPGGDAP